MSKNVASRSYALLWAKSGVGGVQPNLGNACILGVSGPEFHPLLAAIKAEKLLPASKSDGCQCHTIGVIISSQPSRPIIFRCFSVLKIVANILRFTLVVNNRSNDAMVPRTSMATSC